MSAKLTAKQEAFCQELLIDNNATAAAERAGYSPRTARQQAAQLLRIDKVVARLAALRSARANRIQITADSVLDELRIIARSSVWDYVVTADRISIAPGADPAAIRAVQSLKIRTRTSRDGTITQETEIRLWSKVEALQLVGRHLGMWTDRLDITTMNIDLNELTNEELDKVIAGEPIASILKRRRG